MHVPIKKLMLDVTTGTGLGVVNDMDAKQTLVMNIIIIIGRVVLEIIQNRRERKRKREAETN